MKYWTFNYEAPPSWMYQVLPFQARFSFHAFLWEWETHVHQFERRGSEERCLKAPKSIWLMHWSCLTAQPPSWSSAQMNNDSWASVANSVTTMKSKVQQFLLILCKPVFVHTCCSVSNKPGLEHIFWSGLTLYSSTNVLALP